jgi:hypothetical protein
MNGSLKLRLLDGRFAISVLLLLNSCKNQEACVTSLVRCSLQVYKNKVQWAPFIAAQLSYWLLRSEEEAAAHAMHLCVGFDRS